ncbi:MAG: hypothetical protein B6U94_06260 [Thermofilum sp. ex4484_79]|nr:MAG: hypothetical protein B6U94_06260 [Thermofilum sp. ex4484_79]
MSDTVSLDVLRKIVREEVRKAFLEVLLELIPYISDEEQEEIDQTAGSPDDYKEEDFVEWNGK